MPLLARARNNKQTFLWLIRVLVCVALVYECVVVCVCARSRLCQIWEQKAVNSKRQKKSAYYVFTPTILFRCLFQLFSRFCSSFVCTRFLLSFWEKFIWFSLVPDTSTFCTSLFPFFFRFSRYERSCIKLNKFLLKSQAQRRAADRNDTREPKKELLIISHVRISQNIQDAFYAHMNY